MKKEEKIGNKAYTHAIRLLGIRSRTVVEMEKELIEKGFGEQIVKDVVRKLRDQNYINDERYAMDFIQSRNRSNPIGRVLAEAKLLEKGVPEDITLDALDKFLSEDKEKELALDLARKKLKTFTKLKKISSTQKAKVGRFLSGRGFAEALIWEVFDKI